MGFGDRKRDAAGRRRAGTDRTRLGRQRTTCPPVLAYLPPTGERTAGPSSCTGAAAGSRPGPAMARRNRPLGRAITMPGSGFPHRRRRRPGSWPYSGTFNGRWNVTTGRWLSSARRSWTPSMPADADEVQ